MTFWKNDPVKDPKPEIVALSQFQIGFHGEPLPACSDFAAFYALRSAEGRRDDTNAHILREVSKLNEMRKVMILTMFIAVTLVTSFSTVYAYYGWWFTAGTVKCDFPLDSNVIARVRVYLLKRGTSLLPGYPGYVDLLCSYTNSDTEYGMTRTKPTDWKVEWLFLVDGFSVCRGSKSGDAFPATMEPKCSTGTYVYSATVTIAAPAH